MFGLMKCLDVRTWMMYSERRVTSGGSNSLCSAFFQASMECVGARKAIDCRTAWATNDPLYKRIKCNAFAKYFKDFRIVQLWCFNIKRWFSNQKFCSFLPQLPFFRRHTLVINKNINDFFQYFNTKKKITNFYPIENTKQFYGVRFIGNHLATNEKQHFLKLNPFENLINFLNVGVSWTNHLEVSIFFIKKKYLWLKFQCFSAINSFHFRSVYTKLIVFPKFCFIFF